MKLRSTAEKIYNLDVKKEIEINKMVKKDNSLNKEEIEKIVSIITAWSICRFGRASGELYKDKNLLKLAKEDKKLLLEIFNMNSLLINLKNVLSSREYNRFNIDYNYRRSIMYLSLLQIINQGGKTYGAEYGLIFAKTFNYDLALPMRYASYDEGINDPKLKEYIDTYLKLGGSKDVYWLSSYYNEDKKRKYNMEELEYVIRLLEIKQYVKR